ncbi:MAG: hypothetical protein Q7U39_16420 [Nitrospira sp.]|nr:hypothetical protein [Nitrospira sp.]
MGQITAKKHAAKLKRQAERDEAIRREEFGKGYQAGLMSGFGDGFIEGQCAGFEEGVSGGYTRCAANYKNRSFWARLRYLINPNSVI